MIGESWTGAGDHTGHTITAIDEWRPRLQGTTATFEENGAVRFSGGYLSVGRVRCSCGSAWDVGGWPLRSDLL